MKFSYFSLIIPILFLVPMVVFANESPYSLIYGIGNCTETIENCDIQKIAKYFKIIEGGLDYNGMELVRKINHDMRFIIPINSSYTGVNDGKEARELESNNRDHISMHVVATLKDNINSNQNEFFLIPEKSEKDMACLKASANSGIISKSTKKFVTWIRIQSEIMKIVSFNSDLNSIIVQRGFANTNKTAHESAAKVFSPIYIGAGESGPNRPGAEGEGNIRYAYAPDSNYLFNVKSQEIEKYMNQGYDGAKLDILDLAFYNQSDACGNSVIPWNFENNDLYNPFTYRLTQEKKIAYIQNYIFKKFGKYPVLFGNSLRSKYFFPEDGGTIRYMLETDVKPRPIDGMQMENFVGVVHKNTFIDISGWKQRLNILIHCAQNGLSAVALIEYIRHFDDHELGRPNPVIAQHELFGYSSYLMGYEPKGKTYVSAQVFIKVPGEDRRIVYLPKHFFYDLGNPLQSFKDIEGYRVTDTEIYKREFSRGVVYVNPSEKDVMAVALESRLIDPESGKEISTVDLQAHTGKILLRP